MTAQQTREALIKLALAHGEGIEEKLAALPPEAKNERGALKMTQNMVQNCVMWVNIEFAGRYYEVREKRVFTELPLFGGYRKEWEKLSEEEQKRFLIYAFPLTMIRHAFLLPHRGELQGECKAADRFKAEVICGLLGDILREWQDWWRENGCLSCEVEI